ncbi:hypothetical protein VKS41_001464 [Umbelopsis sp. WA50703]
MPPRAKRRKTEPSKTETQTEENFLQLEEYFNQCLKELVEVWPSIKDSISEAEPPPPSDSVDTDSSNMIDFVKNAELVKVVKSLTFQLDPEQSQRTMVLEDTNSIELPEIYNTIISNLMSQYVTLAVEPGLQRYLIPAGSTFLMGQLDDSMKTLTSHAEAQGGYDFIVVDPPWPNKSAHRSSQYTTLDIYALFEIPLPKLMAAESIVAVWVTNRPKYKRFLIDKLFPAWDLELLGEWYWLKMTTAGDPVMPLNSTHRKPYELLLVAKRKSESGSNVPEKQLFASLPSRSHSRKPPLNDLFAQYLPTNPRCLEMFARCLTASNTSWGNECLLFQHESYFTHVEDTTLATQSTSI